MKMLKNIDYAILCLLIVSSITVMTSSLNADQLNDFFTELKDRGYKTLLVSASIHGESKGQYNYPKLEKIVREGGIDFDRARAIGLIAKIGEWVQLGCLDVGSFYLQNAQVVVADPLSLKRTLAADYDGTLESFLEDESIWEGIVFPRVGSSLEAVPIDLRSTADTIIHISEGTRTGYELLLEIATIVGANSVICRIDAGNFSVGGEDFTSVLPVSLREGDRAIASVSFQK